MSNVIGTIIILWHTIATCHADTIIASTPYQYEHDTITCSNEDCTISCIAKNSCHYTNIHCPSNHSCTIHCTANNQDDYSCAFAQIYCPDKGQCDVICDGRKENGYGFACFGAVMHWPTSLPFKDTYSLQCNGGNACQNIAINAQSNHTAFNFDCSGFNGCQYSKIFCPTNEECYITCNGSYACDHVELFCPTDSSCTIDCAGHAACNFATINWPPASANAVSTMICDYSLYSNPCGNVILPPTTPPTISPTISGIGCVNGNICIKTASFGELDTPPIWWVSIFDTQLLNSLTPGCNVSNCSSIQLKETSQTQWINGTHLDSVGCQFSLFPEFTAQTSSVDVRIKTTSNHVIVGIGIIKALLDNTEWDFGSNFVTCLPTDPPTSVPTTIPSNTPTGNPTKNPSKNPTVNPSTNPTKYPTVYPTFIPTLLPTFSPITAQPTSQPTSYPTANIPTNTPSINPSILDDREVSHSTTIYIVSHVNDDLKSDAKSISVVYIVLIISSLFIVVLIIACMRIYMNRKHEKHKMDKDEQRSPSTMMATMNTNQKNENVKRITGSIFSENLTSLNAVNNVLMDDVVDGMDNDEYVGTTTRGFDHDLSKDIVDTESDSTKSNNDDDILDDIDTNVVETIMSGENENMNENINDIAQDPEVIDLEEEQTLKRGRILSEGPKNEGTQLYESKSDSNNVKSVKFAEEYETNGYSEKRKKKQSVEELLLFNETPKAAPIDVQYELPNELELAHEDSEEMFEQREHRKKSTIGTVSEFNGENTDEGNV